MAGEFPFFLVLLALRFRAVFVVMQENFLGPSGSAPINAGRNIEKRVTFSELAGLPSPYRGPCVLESAEVLLPVAQGSSITTRRDGGGGSGGDEVRVEVMTSVNTKKNDVKQQHKGDFSKTSSLKRNFSMVCGLWPRTGIDPIRSEFPDIIYKKSWGSAGAPNGTRYYEAAAGLGHRLTFMSMSFHNAFSKNATLGVLWPVRGQDCRDPNSGQKKIEDFFEVFFRDSAFVHSLGGRMITHKSQRLTIRSFMNSNNISKKNVSSNEPWGGRTASPASRKSVNLFGMFKRPLKPFGGPGLEGLFFKQLLFQLRPFHKRAVAKFLQEEFSDGKVIGIHVRAGNGEDVFLKDGRAIGLSFAVLRKRLSLIAQHIAEKILGFGDKYKILLATDTPAFEEDWKRAEPGRVLSRAAFRPQKGFMLGSHGKGRRHLQLNTNFRRKFENGNFENTRRGTRRRTSENVNASNLCYASMAGALYDQISLANVAALLLPTWSSFSNSIPLHAMLDQGRLVCGHRSGRMRPRRPPMRPNVTLNKSRAIENIGDTFVCVHRGRIFQMNFKFSDDENITVS